MDRLKIPSTVALLGLSFTPSCGHDDDPIVGKWKAIEAEGVALPYMSEYVSYSIEMVIRDDFTGVYSLNTVLSYEGETQNYDYDYPLTVDVDDAPTYKITIEDMETPLICQLSGKKLDCDDGQIIFSK